MKLKFCIAVAVVAASFGFSSTAGAIDACEGSTAEFLKCSTEVGGQGTPGDPVQPDTAAGVEVLGTTQVRGQQLPVTGAETALLVGAGLGLVAAGGTLVFRTRRTATS